MIHLAHVPTLVSEFAPHEFVAFASDLYDVVPEMKTGFPGTVPTTLGNKQPFVLQGIDRDGEGDILWARYRQDLGCLTLKVFND